MSIVFDALSDIFLSIVDMVLSRKTDDRANGKEERHDGEE